MGIVGSTSVSTGVPFARELRRYGASEALVSNDQRLTYTELADRVDAISDELFHGERRLVLLTAAFDVDVVCHLLAALATGNPVFVAPADDPAKLKQWVQHYDPDVIITRHHDQLLVHERRAESAHELHPDLALLVSTSGSTGSPKLVRLSATNVQTNAEQVADALGITEVDRSLTVLPFAYVYGLSVLTTHLLTGATVVLNDASVVEPRFWSRAIDEAITSFAGVPYTYELLDRLGPEQYLARLSTLRQLTVSGGRLTPVDVARYAAIAQRQGFDFAPMYGQSEATARISVARLPDVVDNPASVGYPLPGTSITIDRSAPRGDANVYGTAEDFGELVFAGPNMMLGYAHSSADLAHGQVITELRTGDLARFDNDGRLEIVGRESRFSKIYGLRVDLQLLEDTLHDEGIAAHIVNDDAVLVVVAESAQPDAVARRVRELTGLPERAVTAIGAEVLPRASTGKLDGAALRALAHERTTALRQQAESGVPSEAADPVQPSAQAVRVVTAIDADSVRAELARCLGRPDAAVDDSFVTLGGDSLSHVEMSVRLEAMLGTLPDDWPTRTAVELAAIAVRPEGRPLNERDDDESAGPRADRRRWRNMDTAVLIRAVAIITIVSGHAGALPWRGGAILLIAVAGYNVARFLLSGVERTVRVRHLINATLGVAVPSLIWIWIQIALTDRYDWTDGVLIHYVLGGDEPAYRWNYWFIEVLVVLLAGTALFMAIPFFDRAERRWPFLVPLGVVLVGLLGRFEVFVTDPGETFALTPWFAVWVFGLGWLIQRAHTFAERAVALGLVLVLVPGHTPYPAQVVYLLLGLLALLFVRTVRVPSFLVPPIATVASASLWIYLTHWQVYPHVTAINSVFAVVVCVLVGIVMSRLWTSAMRAVRGRWRQRVTNDADDADQPVRREPTPDAAASGVRIVAPPADDQRITGSGENSVRSSDPTRHAGV